MIPVRLKKVVADLAVRWGRALLTLAGLSLGLFGVGAVLTAFVMLSKDLNANYRQTNPPNIVLVAEGLSRDAAVAAARSAPGIAQVEHRPAAMARIQTPMGRWMPIQVFVVEDFSRLPVAAFYRHAGAFPPARGGLLVERDGNFFLRAEPGERLPLRLPDGRIAAAALSGFAFDPGQAPSRMEQVIYGYVSPATAGDWGLAQLSPRLLITVQPGRSANAVSGAVEAAVARAGGRVVQVSFQDVATHPHQFQFQALVALLGALAAVSFIMCAVLIANLIDSIMAAELRTIGMMRAMGGRPGQIARDYLIGMGLVGMIAAAAALPFTLATGRGMARMVAMSVNFNLLSPEGPPWLTALIIANGVVIAVVVAALRVARATAMPVREALSRSDPAQNLWFAGGLGRVFAALPMTPRMALRALARKPRRTLFTALTLAIGLAFFQSALNVRTSMMDTVDAVGRTKPHDLALYLGGAYPVEALRAYLAQAPNVARTEFWRAAEGGFRRGGMRLTNAVRVLGAPYETKALKPEIVSGRWLDPARPDGIVVTHRLLIDEPSLRQGGRYDLDLGAGPRPVQVIGVIKEFGPGLVYAPEALLPLGDDGERRSNLLLVTLKESSVARQVEAAGALEGGFAERGWRIGASVTSRMLEAVVTSHLDMIAGLLLVIAALALMVGGLGLASSVSVSVVERRREIGVMKAIGGRSGAISRLFAWEAVFTAVLAWTLATAAAPLLSRETARIFGELIVQYPFNYRPDPWGPPLALAAAVLIALIACLPPIRSAVRTTVHKALRTA